MISVGRFKNTARGIFFIVYIYYLTQSSGHLLQSSQTYFAATKNCVFCAVQLFSYCVNIQYKDMYTKNSISELSIITIAVTSVIYNIESNM